MKTAKYESCKVNRRDFWMDRNQEKESSPKGDPHPTLFQTPTDKAPQARRRIARPRSHASLLAAALACATVLAPAGGALAADDKPAASSKPGSGGKSAPQKWEGWAEFGGFFGTDNASRGEVTFFAPLAQSPDDLFFADLRGKLFEDDVQEGNFALGYRRMLRNGWNPGVWGGFDLRSSEQGNLFWQLSGGAEMLSDRWDIRVNGYAPVSQPQSSPGTAKVFLSGNSILMSGGEEVPLFGVDGEVGYKLFGSQPIPGGLSTGLRVYAGGFYFDDDDAAKSIAGPRARVEFRIDDVIPPVPGSRLTVESEYSHDDVRDGKWEIGARLRIPFSAVRESRAVAFSALTPQERRMVEGLERDTDIVTAKSKDETVVDNATGAAMNRVAIANSAATLQTAVANGGNTLIILQSAGANIDVSATDGQALQASQTLQGGGSTIQMRGSRSGAVAPFTAPGSRPTMVSSDTNAATGVVTMASHSHVAGLNIRGAGGVGTAAAGNDGIRGLNNLSRVAVQQNDIANMGGAGMRFDNNNDVWVANNNLSNMNTDAISFEAGNTAVITGNAIRDTGAEGIDLGGSSLVPNTLIITNNVFAGSIGTEAFEFDGAVDILLDGSGNTVLPGATVNGTATPATGDLCLLSAGTAGFIGTLEITDPAGARRTLVNGDGCS